MNMRTFYRKFYTILRISIFICFIAIMVNCDSITTEVSSINEGGDRRYSENYTVENDAIGQGVVGRSSSENYVLNAGSVPSMDEPSRIRYKAYPIP